nr:non-reducing polyketide synthase azaa [Quercus suber]
MVGKISSDSISVVELIYTTVSYSRVVSYHSSPRHQRDEPSCLITKGSVILCFGEPSARVSGLCRDLYESTSLLRQHLDECDAALRSMGVDSIFPQLSDKDQISNLTRFQTRLFSLQCTVTKR